MYAMVYSGALKGAGDTRSPFLITLCSMWGVRILGSFILIRLLHKDLPWMCAAMCLDNVVRFFLYLHCYRKGKWVHAYEKHESRSKQRSKEQAAAE